MVCVSAVKLMQHKHHGFSSCNLLIYRHIKSDNTKFRTNLFKVEKGMKDISPIGFFAGLIAWFVFVIISSGDMACVRNGGCDQGNLLLFSVISTGLIAPSWIVALVVSIFFPNK